MGVNDSHEVTFIYFYYKSAIFLTIKPTLGSDCTNMHDSALDPMGMRYPGTNHFYFKQKFTKLL